jgi:hypothetical protein
MAEAEQTEYNTNAQVFSEGNAGSALVSSSNDIKIVNGNLGESYYSELSKYYAEKTEVIAENIKELAQQCIAGMILIKINQNDWVTDNGRYKVEIDNLLALTGVFKGTWQQKKMVSVDMTLTDKKAIIYSYEAFDGYALGARTLIDTGETSVTTGILDSMLSTEIIDITT